MLETHNDRIIQKKRVQEKKIKKSAQVPVGERERNVWSMQFCHARLNTIACAALKAKASNL